MTLVPFWKWKAEKIKEGMVLTRYQWYAAYGVYCDKERKRNKK